MKNCLFCQMVQGKIPCYKLYENKQVLAFLDINPINKGHALVITKKHARNLFDVSKKDLEAAILATKKLSAKIKANLGAEGINLLQSNESAAGQEIFHLHFHIVPRFANDRLRLWPGKKSSSKDLARIHRKILDK